MEDQNRNKEIELRSEEVQEVMSHIPPAVLRYGIGVLSAVVILLLAGSAFFRYPDRVEAELTLTTQSPPAYIIAGNSGRIERLYVANRQDVRKDDLLGVIGNTADTEDMLYLRERLRVWKNSGSRIESVEDLLFNRLPELGSVQASYAACRLAWDNYLHHMQERIYGTELMNAVASLSVSLSEWEKNYLLTSPVDGQVAFMQLWKPNQNIETGETVFVVIPHDAVVPIGKALGRSGSDNVPSSAFRHFRNRSSDLLKDVYLLSPLFRMQTETIFWKSLCLMEWRQPMGGHYP